MSASGGYHAVVLAAGAASRFGGSKLTAPYERGVLLDATLRAACAAPVESVVVVTGAHGNAVEAAVAAFVPFAGLPIRAVPCADHARGMSASISCGLAALTSDAAGAFIFLGDMPNIPRTVPPKLLDAVLSGSLAAIPSAKGRWGHPVLILRTLFGPFSDLGGDGSGRAMLRRLGRELAVVEVEDEGVLTDIDTRSELEAILQAADGTSPTLS